MAEKHEFDVRILTRGSRSPDLERPSQALGIDDSPLLSPSPPPYSIQDEYFPVLSGDNSSISNSAYGVRNVPVKSYHISPPDQPFIYESSSSTPAIASLLIRILNPSPQVSRRGETVDVANLILRPKEPLLEDRIISRRNRGDFKSEFWEAPKEIIKLAEAQPAKTRRNSSRTFPADISTQPHLDEIYDEPYVYHASSVGSPAVRCQFSKSTRDLSRELEHAEIQLKALQSEIGGVERQYSLLSPLLLRTDKGDSNTEVWVRGKREEATYQILKKLEGQQLIMFRELEIVERRQKSIYEELKKRREAREPLEEPLKIMARQMNERNVGRRWLRGEIPWVDALDMGRGEPHTTNSTDMMRDEPY
ncbi:hypothetical protein SBOR_1965 [Sclerotinia borealis F-4128]|uniref:Uncharacterized protein n=1 Tax=Sclerotinia borealis (strain F-4128) TaxID=1432307 RepID=W9CSS6_SCLBF|nr:hypothetical protein SBOR_1965 [Sclerotinia borealis F-4128]